MLKIYLTDLAAYNKGYLYGEWLELPQDQSMLNDKLIKILKSGEALCFIECGYYEKHEEYFITDYEWDDNEMFKVDEYDNLESLNERLQALEGKSEYELKAISFLMMQGIAATIDDAVQRADDVIIHEDQTMEDVANNFIQECYQVDELPSIISNHIDYQGVARDLEMDGTYYIVDGDVYEYLG